MTVDNCQTPRCPSPQARRVSPKVTEGLLLTSLSSFCSLPSISQSLSLAFARQLPLHKGAFSVWSGLFSSRCEPCIFAPLIIHYSLFNLHYSSSGCRWRQPLRTIPPSLHDTSLYTREALYLKYFYKIRKRYCKKICFVVKLMCINVIYQ